MVDAAWYLGALLLWCMCKNCLKLLTMCSPLMHHAFVYQGLLLCWTEKLGSKAQVSLML